jgi:hypothetical protein
MKPGVFTGSGMDMQRASEPSQVVADRGGDAGGVDKRPGLA